MANNKKSVLDCEVSYFKNIKDVNAITINLLRTLDNRDYETKVEELRSTKDEFTKKQIKSSIGCITPSGIFSKRNSDSLIKHSGLIQFDIDFKDNLDISNYDKLREEISKSPNVAYVGLSVSGKGYWGLIPISDGEKHKLFFKSIEKVFKAYGINIDPSGSDVVRLRILSYDPLAYYNHNAITLNKPYEEILIKHQEIPKKKSNVNLNNSPEINALLALILEYNIDITNGYDNWFALGSFFNTLKDGNILFHQISILNKTYNEKEAENHFNKCKKYSDSYNIGSLYRICKNCGINICTGYMVSYGDNYQLIDAEVFQFDENEMFSFKS